MEGIPRPEGISRTTLKVQDYIRTLEQRVTFLQDQIRRDAASGPEVSNVTLMGRHGSDEDKALGVNRQVAFFMGEGRRRIDDCITVRHDRNDRRHPGRLRIESSSSLIVQGSAANALYVEIERN
jgi:hypothetical protein